MTEHSKIGGLRRFYARPADRSFEAYKQFLKVEKKPCPRKGTDLTPTGFLMEAS